MVVDRSRRQCLLCKSCFNGRAFVCRSCADRYREGPIPDHVLRTFYREVDREYPEWANTYGNYNPPRSLLAYIDRMDRDLKVLEIGSGGGFLLEELWRRGFRNLTGSEITGTALAEMTRRDMSALIVGADAESLPFRDGTYDLIVSSDVIEHLPRVEGHLSEVHRVLRPGGLYLLKTPNRRPAELYYRLRGLYDHHIWHPSMFTPGELTALFQTFCFETAILPVNELTTAQVRKIPTRLMRAVALRLPIGALPFRLHPHLEVVATRSK